MAISKFDQFDFLIDIVPRDELKPVKRQVLYSFVLFMPLLDHLLKSPVDRLVWAGLHGSEVICVSG